MMIKIGNVRKCTAWIWRKF